MEGHFVYNVAADSPTGWKEAWAEIHETGGGGVEEGEGAVLVIHPIDESSSEEGLTERAGSQYQIDESSRDGHPSHTRRNAKRLASKNTIHLPLSRYEAQRVLSEHSPSIEHPRYVLILAPTHSSSASTRPVSRSPSIQSLASSPASTSSSTFTRKSVIGLFPDTASSRASAQHTSASTQKQTQRKQKTRPSTSSSSASSSSTSAFSRSLAVPSQQAQNAEGAGSSASWSAAAGLKHLRRFSRSSSTSASLSSSTSAALAPTLSAPDAHSSSSQSVQQQQQQQKPILKKSSSIANGLFHSASFTASSGSRSPLVDTGKEKESSSRLRNHARRLSDALLNHHHPETASPSGSAPPPSSSAVWSRAFNVLKKQRPLSRQGQTHHSTSSSSAEHTSGPSTSRMSSISSSSATDFRSPSTSRWDEVDDEQDEREISNSSWEHVNLTPKSNAIAANGHSDNTPRSLSAAFRLRNGEPLHTKLARMDSFGSLRDLSVRSSVTSLRKLAFGFPNGSSSFSKASMGKLAPSVVVDEGDDSTQLPMIRIRLRSEGELNAWMKAIESHTRSQSTSAADEEQRVGDLASRIEGRTLQPSSSSTSLSFLSKMGRRASVNYAANSGIADAHPIADTSGAATAPAASSLLGRRIRSRPATSSSVRPTSPISPQNLSMLHLEHSTHSLHGSSSASSSQPSPSLYDWTSSNSPRSATTATSQSGDGSRKASSSSNASVRSSAHSARKEPLQTPPSIPLGGRSIDGLRGLQRTNSTVSPSSQSSPMEVLNDEIIAQRRSRVAEDVKPQSAFALLRLRRSCSNLARSASSSDLVSTSSARAGGTSPAANLSSMGLGLELQPSSGGANNEGQRRERQSSSSSQGSGQSTGRLPRMQSFRSSIVTAVSSQDDRLTSSPSMDKASRFGSRSPSSFFASLGPASLARSISRDTTSSGSGESTPSQISPNFATVPLPGGRASESNTTTSNEVHAGSRLRGKIQRLTSPLSSPRERPKELAPEAFISQSVPDQTPPTVRRILPPERMIATLDEIGKLDPISAAAARVDLERLSHGFKQENKVLNHARHARSLNSSPWMESPAQFGADRRLNRGSSIRSSVDLASLYPSDQESLSHLSSSASQAQFVRGRPVSMADRSPLGTISPLPGDHSLPCPPRASKRGIKVHRHAETHAANGTGLDLGTSHGSPLLDSESPLISPLRSTPSSNNLQAHDADKLALRARSNSASTFCAPRSKASFDQRKSRGCPPGAAIRNEDPDATTIGTSNSIQSIASNRTSITEVEHTLQTDIGVQK